MTFIRDLDIVFITYDEPDGDKLFEQLCSISPRRPLRLHGVKGFDTALKTASALATTSRFIVVDGDNAVRPWFFQSEIDDALPSDTVFSFTAMNTVNGLAYGNGGIKIWPREIIAHRDTHENSKDGGNDYCWAYRYWQVNDIASDVFSAQSPYHAYRAAYREAIKLSLVEDQKLSTWQETTRKMYPPNLSRLMIWASVGRDCRHGIWSILGAREGFVNLWRDNLDPRMISDYDWFLSKWNKVKTDDPETKIRTYDNILKDIGFEVRELDASMSEWIKRVYVNPERHGWMIPDVVINET